MIELRDRLANRVVDSYDTLEAAAFAYGTTAKKLAKIVDYTYLPATDWYYWTDGKAKQPKAGHKRAMLLCDGKKIYAFSNPGDFRYVCGIDQTRFTAWAKLGRVRLTLDGEPYEAVVLKQPIANDARVVRIGGQNQWGYHPLI